LQLKATSFLPCAFWFVTKTCHTKDSSCHNFFGDCLVHCLTYDTPHFLSILPHMS
jgi:hypothetical protein